ncbi:gluconate 2-dehydrogenase subunit 3 family protein [Sinomonas sp. P10A9]|uniref:Gluconate 2-dehydrogenase subunit 3 family protein n=1 Tax=Sinomonas puerhi TaxID=3238584 RepID=A0AB39L4C7_9MICC
MDQTARALRVLTPYQAAQADALFETLFPAGQGTPGAVETGVTEYLDLTLEGHSADDLPRYQWFFAALEETAQAKYGHAFAEATIDERHDIVSLAEQGELSERLPAQDQRDFFGLVVAHLQEGLFADPVHGGNKDALGWKFLRHPGVWLENSAEENLSEEHVLKDRIKTLADALSEIPRDTEGHRLKQLGYENAVNPQLTDEVDVLLVGVGAMGGVSAQVFAEAGLSVVGLEAGPFRPLDEFLPDELEHAYYTRGGLGPKFQLETPRWREDTSEPETKPATFSLGRMVNGVGGSAGHYGSWLRRFHEWQFAPKSHYENLYGRNVLPEDCSLADWPVAYKDLEPYYTRLEHLIGIAGDGSNPFVTRSRALPLPPTRPFVLGQKFTDATRAAGLHPHPVPVGFTTEAYDGRRATGYSAWNNGLGSFLGDRWHPGLGPVPAAIATGRFELRTHSRVTRIITDETGAARGVEWIDPRGRVRTQYARAVVLSAYTYENLRLMFLSADAKHSDGLGNNSGQLGRHYMTKMFGHVDATFPDVNFNRHTGPAAQGVVLDDFLSKDFRSLEHGFLGGATLGAEQQALPLQIARETLPPSVPSWGPAYRDHLAKWPHQGVIRIQPDALPYASHRIDMDPLHRDRSGLGMPLVRVTYRLRENERKLAAWMAQRASGLLRDMGATETWEGPFFTGVGSSHDLGGARFGHDPAGSVLDENLAVHDTKNLYMYSGAAFPSCPGINPTLTIWAVVMRAAEHLARQLGGALQEGAAE